MQVTVALVYLLIVCCNVLLNVHQIIYTNTFSKEVFSTVTGQMLSSGLFTCTGVMYILSMIHSVYFRREVRLILDKFMQFDATFQNHFAPVNHANHRRLLLRYIVGSVCLVLGLIPMSHMLMEGERFNPPFTFTFLVFGCVSTLNYAVLQSHTILSVSAVLVRVIAVNKELSTMHKAVVEGATQWRTVGGNVARVEQCRILHDILNDIVELINLCFTFCAMWCTLASFGYCLMSMYSDYEILTRGESQSWKFVCVNFAWNLYYTVYSTAIVWVASRTRTEANRTTALVHKIINASTEPILTDEVDLHEELCVACIRGGGGCHFLGPRVRGGKVIRSKILSCMNVCSSSSNWRKPFSLFVFRAAPHILAATRPSCSGRVLRPVQFRLEPVLLGE